jgi:hypothetical protein
MIPVEIHPRSRFSSLDATSLKYESYSLANKEIMKLKFKKQGEWASKNSWAKGKIAKTYGIFSLFLLVFMGMSTPGSR